MGLLITIPLAIVIFVLIRTYFWDRLPKLPGPYGFPILGCLPFVGGKMNEVLYNWSKKYGPVFQLQLGSQRNVIVCGQDAIREALVGAKATDFAARPYLYSYEGFGVFGIPGYPRSFKVYKKLTLRAMGLFANNRRDELQEAAYRAVDMMVDEFGQKGDEAFDPKLILYKVVWTIMGYICYGRYFNKDDPEVVNILKTADEFGTAVMFGVLYDYLPWTKPLMRKQLERSRVLTENIFNQSKKLAAANMQTWDGKSLRNLADMFWKADEEMEAEDKAALGISEEKIKGMLTNLFGAGFATVAVTLKWSFLYMAKYPEIQDKLHHHIIEVIGRQRPTFDDQSKLDFANAVLTEVYRCSSMASLAMTHATTRDTVLNGYPIPEGTPVVFNLYSGHYDDAYFPSPKKFDPERFLTPSGQLDTKTAELIFPYGLGLRRCGGEILAKLEIWLFFIVIFQKWEVLPSPEEKLDPEEYRFGLGLDPKPFKVIFKARN